MKILGISCFYHDSAAAIVVDGVVKVAVQEERFTRVKHDASFPKSSIDFCLKSLALSLKDIDYIVFYEKPFKKFDRIVETYFSTFPTGFKNFSMSMPTWAGKKIFQKSLLATELAALSDESIKVIEDKLRFCEHHLSHAASAFFPSGYNDALVVTMDGVGEFTTTSVAEGIGSRLYIRKEIYFPHSLGLLYSAFTYFCGFKVNSGEYKMMGLAPYGRPIFYELLRDNLIRTFDDGSFQLNMKFFSYDRSDRMVGDKFAKLLGFNARVPEAPLDQQYKDLAASAQKLIEELILEMLTALHEEYGHRNLCLAGGVALNCVANGKIKETGLFENIYIQPAAGDAGGALGAALAFYFNTLSKNKKVATPSNVMNSAYLGSQYSSENIQETLNSLKATFDVVPYDQIPDIVSSLLVKGAAVGWFQGRMEFGPRALGARSILADPRSPNMQRDLNLKIKFRESFRPFAPCILEECVQDWFEFDGVSPYMLMVAKIRNEKLIFADDTESELISPVPAVTHLDMSSRLQTVSKSSNPLLYEVLFRFQKLTGIPMLVNTSFNVRNEPIVQSPSDAFRCFMATNLDTLVMENCVLHKIHQDKTLAVQYHQQFAPD